VKFNSLIRVILLGSLFYLFSFWLGQNLFSFVFNISAQDFTPISKVTVWNATFNPFNVVLNVIVLSLFGLFIIIGNKSREKGTGLTAGVYSAFIAALFIEMYGLNLSLFIFTWAFGNVVADNLYNLFAVFTGQNVFRSIFIDFILPISNMMILIGILLVIFGWRQIYRANGELVTTSLYARIRHPQYTGFLLITLGMIVLWPVPTTVILWPLIFALYRHLAKKEEKRMEKLFGEEYQRYKSTVPMFLPRI
jgi:protein-S-isoprenylcysteine O-methyltransferase Ste14